MLIEAKIGANSLEDMSQAESVLRTASGSRAGSFWTEPAAGSIRVHVSGSSATSRWLGLSSSGSSFFKARLKPDRVGSRPALLRLAVPPLAPSPTPRRRQLNPRACSNAVAVAAAPAALQLPRALRGAAPGAWWRRRGVAAVCCASAHVSAESLQWVSIGAAALLMLAKGTAVQKSFLVPFVALQAPSDVIKWIRGDHGQWTAFLWLLLRLLYFIPGELELPLSTMLFVSIAPHQFFSLRATQDSIILSLAIAAYLAFQHFTGAGSLRKAFDREAVVASPSSA